MHIKWLFISSLPPLRSMDVSFNERVNLFVGSNASGKSTLLRAIKGFHSVVIEGERDDRFEVYYHEEYDEQGDSTSVHSPNNVVVEISTSQDWPRDTEGVKWGAVPFLYIPATRVSLSGSHVFDQKIEEPKDIKIDSLHQKFTDRVGSGYRLDTSGFLKHAVNAESGIFDARRIGLAIDQLALMMPQLSSSLKDQFEKTVQVGYECASRICTEVVSGFAPHPYVDNLEMPGETRYFMGVSTRDPTPDTLYAGDLSSGTQDTILWIYAIVLQMASHYGWAEGWETKPALLLIDEIENHLHPTWQRRVIPALLEHFPGLQIFATTHSPFVVAGLKAGQVHLLKRDENGVVTASTNTEDIVGWTADEILRNLMGVDEPTDQLTVDRANRLRQLRAQDSLTPDEESELNDLRRQVNEDLLSKEGSLGAQKERYADLMEQFIRSRQAELSQDGD